MSDVVRGKIKKKKNGKNAKVLPGAEECPARVSTACLSLNDLTGASSQISPQVTFVDDFHPLNGVSEARQESRSENFEQKDRRVPAGGRAARTGKREDGKTGWGGRKRTA